MKRDTEQLLGEFNTLETSDRAYKVDRFASVHGLGTFFFNGGYEEEHLVYSAVGFESPQLIGNEHYVVREKTERGYGGTLYIKREKNERIPTVKEGEPGILLEHIGKIALFNEHDTSSKEAFLASFDKQIDENPSEKQLELLQLFAECSKVVQLSYDGYAKVNTDGDIKWVKHHLVYSPEEALEEMKAIRRLHNEIKESKRKTS
ncbi:hypothetical protein JMA_38010 (plasmid) [Jeotgalibacillus malaysiensis]|uniref:Uncharacterized protein n=1 Tax=Jeotgalibacillus malaysiensis TaxID=1508404 RepID=A0A0B5AYP4_9BACL|nr:hypothetical protein [Jeotgalibacillus malaysiensis]AJD93119.1 hypothetical protein JMA_38010 [Jeotgalibacillus malaysiensis]